MGRSGKVAGDIMSQPTYKFKWTNIDLNGYMQDRRFIAQKKRREAEILVREAEAIETEMSELQIALLLVVEKEKVKSETQPS